MHNPRQNIRAQWLICITALVLFGIKIAAWWMTGSVAVLTDALESIVNVMTGFFGLYSLYLSALPKDENHPYGHGKVEFLSAALEGMLIMVAGGIIMYEAVLNLGQPHELKKLDMGIIFISFSALANFLVGAYAIRLGKKLNTLPLISSGKHLQSDTWSTLGIIVGLFLLRFTGLNWIDSAVAILFSIIILYTGVKILRTSLAGIMDESDRKLMAEMVEYLEAHRQPNWVDLHNLRIIKYGSILHLDCHMTVPWYLNVHQAHDEIEALQELIRSKYGEQVELFVHTDGCLDFSCKICGLENCTERKNSFQNTIHWTVENISTNQKHGKQN